MTDSVTPADLVPSRRARTWPRIAAVAVVLCAALALPSCNVNCQDPQNASSTKCTVIGATVDCTGVSSLPTAVAVATPIVTKLIGGARQADGSVNWTSIEQQIVDLGLQYGGCTVAQVWDDLMTNGASASTSTSTSTTTGIPATPSTSQTPKIVAAAPSLAPDDLKKEFDRIRARVAPGRTFTVRGGKAL